MQGAPNSTQTSAPTREFVTGLGNTAAGLFGGATVGLATLAGTFTDYVGGSSAWIFFCLSLKPLIDLTWRWSFFDFSAQSVDLQALVGVGGLALNAIAIWNTKAWRRLPKRVLLMLAFAALSVMFSPSSWGLNELLRLFAGTTFFYTAGPLLAEARRFDRFAKLFLCAMTVPVILSYFQWAGILPYDYWDWINNQSVGRASGTYPTPLSMSFFLYYAFPVGLAIASGKRHSSWTRAAAFAFLLLASGALALGNHRTAYVIVVLQILVWSLLTRRKKFVFGFLGVLAVVIFLSSAWLETLYTPMEQAISGQANLSNGQLFRGRGFQWLLFLNSYASSGPFHWVFGNGASIIKGYDPEALDVDSVEPHNDFIRILHAYGAVGLLLYLSVLALFLKRTLLLLRSSDEFSVSLALIMVLALIAIFIQSMMMEPMRFPTGVWYFFAIASALFCVERGAKTTAVSV